MRVAFVIYGSIDAVSGGFIYDRALVGALRSLGHEIDVIGLPWHGYARALAHGIARQKSARGDEATPASAAPSPYDVVIQDELIHPSVFLSNRRLSGAPRGKVLVTLVHNLKSRQPGEAFRALKVAVERRYLATVDGVITVCAQTLSDVRDLAGEALPATIAYPGRDHFDSAVDEALVETRSREPGPLRVVYAAAVTPHKGLHRLMEALARAVAGVPNVDVTLDVVGSLAHPSYVRAIRHLMARWDLGPRVKMHGLLQGADLWRIFRQGHVLALPSDREAYSLASLEALGFGLPVLGTSCGGLNEMFSDGVEGTLIPPDDLPAWVEALRRVGSNRSLLRTMGRAALARYRQHGTWRDTALIVQDFLQAQLRRREDRPDDRVVDATRP